MRSVTDGHSATVVWGGFILNGDSTGIRSGSSLSFRLCLDEGCYTAQISMGAYGAEGLLVSVPERCDSSTAVQAPVALRRLMPTSSSTLEAATVWCSVVPTTTRATTTEGANLNDGSCEYLSCAGCIDPTACNYDDTATLDNGTCDYSCVGCLDVNGVELLRRLAPSTIPSLAFLAQASTTSSPSLTLSVTAFAALTAKVLTLSLWTVRLCFRAAISRTSEVWFFLR